MTDYQFDPNENVSEQYLADQRTSEHYARAAKMASRGMQMNTDGTRKIQFEQRNADSADENLIEKREREFRNIISGGKNKDQLENTNQYNLEDLERSERASSGDQMRQRSVKRVEPQPQRNNRKPNVMQNILRELQQALLLLFSKRPMQVFHLNLHWESIGILTFLNILVVGIFNSIVFSKGLKAAFEAAISKVGTGKVFGMSLLSQLLSLVYITVMIFVLSIILQSEKRPLKQFFQTAVLSTIPYSLILIPALFIAIFSPLLGTLIALAGKIHCMIYLYAGFQKGHPTRKNSPYWIFFLLILLLVFLQYLLMRWTLF